MCLPGVGTLLTSICCCVQGVGCMFNCCCCSIPCRGSLTTRLLYSLGLLLVAVISWVFRNWGSEIVPSDNQTCNGDCFAYLAVYRMSMGLVLYHAVLSIAMIGVSTSDDIRAKFNNGFWLVKFVILAATTVGCFYVPNSFFNAYAYIAIVLGILFLIFQTIIIMDFAYVWAESWVAKWEDDDNQFYKFCIIFVTVFCYSFTVAVTVILYVYYASASGCGLNVFFITFNIILVILISVGSILPKVQEANPKSGLMQASILSLYITYIIASAIGSEPSNTDFNCASAPSGNNALSEVLLYVGFICSFFALAISAFSSGSADDSLMMTSTTETDQEALASDEKEGIKYPYWRFHLVFVCAAGYMAVLLTNWSVVSGTAVGDDFTIDSGFGSVWAKVATSWVIVLLYVWILIAPILMPDRFN